MIYSPLFNLEDSLNTHPTRKWYHECLKHSSTKRLLITCGDSWTWGDSLGQISLPEVPDDYEHRTTHIYGQLLANKLDSDFINLAKCGGSNIDMHDMLASILPQVVNRYKKIDVVITLTELLREIIYDPIWVTDELDHSSLENLLKNYECIMFNFFNKLFNSYPSINFLIARNFSVTFKDNFNICPHVEKNWVTVLAENQTIDPYPTDLRILSNMSMTPLIAYLKNNNLMNSFKSELLEQMFLAMSGIEWLENSILNYKKATKHPTEKGHELWADYLYSYLDK
jgi:hypothetical protein